ncbi:MAG: clostripain [Clostridia bacterium]|nr:clostripain [Clostridia bacterium]
MKRIITILLALCMAFTMAGCTIEFVDDVPSEPAAPAVSEPQQVDIGTKTPAAPVSTDETWAIYWYLCGSDLESNYGCGTNDLLEVFNVPLPDNITVVIETGGSKRWHNDTMQTRVLQRYVYSSRGFELVENLDLANMGNPNTLASFLKFCKDNYPADHTMMLFWDHGGGSVAGVAFDELNNYNSLTLDEIHTAFDTVYNLSETNPPFELVGFDTCLMATVDMAATLKDISKYMVASEEVEPGGGWYYNDWLAKLAADPSMDGAALGKIICDSYYRGCTKERIVAKATLSLVDLQKLDGLLDAYETFGDAVLMAASVDPSFTNRFARMATSCESYGGNTREQGFTNMVDLGHVARSCEGLLDGAKAVTKALGDCVLYQIKGQYKSEATGLSFFFPFIKDMKTYNAYTGISASRSFPFFYEYALTGKLDQDGLSYLESLNGAKEVEKPKTLKDTDWQGKHLTVNEEGSAVLTLGPEADKLMSGISFSLYYSDDKSGNVLWLGTDNDIYADWEKGVFTDNFRGVWGAFGGQLVFMELSYEGEDYNIYAVPVMINGEAYKLEVVYDFNDEEWTVLGARKPIDANGMADKNMYTLEEGDKIDVIWYIASASSDKLTPYTVGSFVYDDDTVFEELWLPDGTYTLVFEMRDAGGNTITSAEVDCRIEGENMFMDPK